jgi:hypothetical protein
MDDSTACRSILPVVLVLFTACKVSRTDQRPRALFEPRILTSRNQGAPEFVDGVLDANNPTLLAIGDAVKAFEVTKKTSRFCASESGIQRVFEESCITKSFLTVGPLN